MVILNDIMKKKITHIDIIPKFTELKDDSFITSEFLHCLKYHEVHIVPKVARKIKLKTS